MKESQHTGNAEQHRATPQQWLAMEVDSHSFATASTILELRDRIKALEASQPEHLIDPERERMAQEFMQAAGFAPRSSEPRPSEVAAAIRAAADARAKSNHPAKPGSSLVERVAFAITGDSNELINWKPEARAAIRAVAAWMTSNPDHHFPPALVFALDKEAEHR